MAKKKQLISNPNRIMFFTGDTKKVEKEYNECMCNFVDCILGTYMSGTPDNLVLAVIYNKKVEKVEKMQLFY